MSKKYLLTLSTLAFSLLLVGCGPTDNPTSTPSENPTTSEPSNPTSEEPTLTDPTTSPSVEDSNTSINTTEDHTSVDTTPTTDPNVDPETEPKLSDDKKTITYGLYPQTVVSDETLISELNTNYSNIEENTYIVYKDNFFLKITSTVFKEETYTFDNGSSIENNKSYWFSCEPIVWNVLSSENNTYFSISSVLLDTAIYYKDYEERSINDKTIYSNNYEHSDIRTWLNNDFYNKAFSFNDRCIVTTTVDNTQKTTDSSTNTYISNNTEDKVYLPSYEDYLNSNYGFDSSNNLSSTRTAKTTDFARAKGAWYSKDSGYEFNGTYWTRSPSSKYSYTAKNVNSGGYISDYAVDGASHCVRPALQIHIG